MPKAIDLTGMTIGNYHVVGFARKKLSVKHRSTRSIWNVYKLDKPEHVFEICGSTLSTIKKRGKYRKLYDCWRLMRQRCNRNSYKFRWWNGKGIKVCPEWNIYKDFETWALANDWAEGKELHRIDSDKDYCPTNCVWLTEQEHNNMHMNQTGALKSENAKLISEIILLKTALRQAVGSEEAVEHLLRR